MCRFILIVLSLTVACVPAPESFMGTWEIAAVQPDGASKDARWLVFNADRTYTAKDKNGMELWAGTFEIDPTTSPKTWDHRSDAARKESKEVLGIYHLDGDQLRVACVVGQWKGKEWVGKSRPTGFDPEQVDVLMELKRVKPRQCRPSSEQPTGDKAMLNQLPKPASDFIRTSNGNDPTEFITLFAEDAVVDDAGRIFQGREAIREWAAGDIFAAKVTFDVLEVDGDESDATITAKINGTFDRTGLPDPLFMTLQVASLNGRITKLTCRLAAK